MKMLEHILLKLKCTSQNSEGDFLRVLASEKGDVIKIMRDKINWALAEIVCLGHWAINTLRAGHPLQALTKYFHELLHK